MQIAMAYVTHSYVISLNVSLYSPAVLFLETAPEFDTATQVKLVLFLAALHNFIRHREEDSFYTDSSRVQEEGFQTGLVELYGDAIRGRSASGHTVGGSDGILFLQECSFSMYRF